MLGFHVKFVQTDRRTDRQTDRQTDRWTMVQRYAPDLPMLGHKTIKNCSKYLPKIEAS